MPAQLPLDLPVRAALGRDAFAGSPANAEAVARIEAWPDWPAGKLVLTGPEGAGKTHLAHVWAGLSGATVLPATALAALPEWPRGPVAVEDVPRIAGDAAGEEALFHLHNLAREAGWPLLMTGREAPARWPLTLPDLASRVQGTDLVRIGPPDDALLAHVLVKLFADRHIAPPPDLVAWIVPRMERSFAEAQRLVTEIDRRALTEGRRINRDLARDVLDTQGDLPF